MGAEAKRPTSRVEPGDETLLWMTMSEAAERYGVPGTVMGRRLRQDDKSKSRGMKRKRMAKKKDKAAQV